MSQYRGAKGPGYREAPSERERFFEIDERIWLRPISERRLTWAARKKPGSPGRRDL
ncbi:hypothetical protein M0R72_11630 [Candidatus Pacearchaeota archaeon]|jgi:hypothetical protein|nr:hypothetical protein [Candidatus Pacearchaeota archaeon]